MRQRQSIAAAVVLTACATAHAAHFEYRVDLTGTYSDGGTEGCTAPDFDEPACPKAGALTGILSFDTPSGADGSYAFEGTWGDITDFSVSIGWLPQDFLTGAVNLNGGIPSGIAQAPGESETFLFDWGDRSASYVYDFGSHASNGSFDGFLTAVPEPAAPILLLSALAGLAALAPRRNTARQRDA